MKSHLMTTVAALAGGLVLLCGSAPAMAHDRSGVNWSISIGTGPSVYYAPPAYVAPQPVYVQPQPVYVRPYPVYVTPAPAIVYSQPGYSVYGQPYYYEGHRHGRIRHRDWDDDD